MFQESGRCGFQMKNDYIIDGIRATVNSCLREDELKAICDLYLDDGCEKKDVIGGLNEIKSDRNLNLENREMIDSVIVMLQ